MRQFDGPVPGCIQCANEQVADLRVGLRETQTLDAGSEDPRRPHRLPDLQRAHDEFQCLNRLALDIEQRGKVVERFDIVRRVCQRVAIAGFRFVQLLPGLQQRPQIVVNFGVVRSEFKCSPITGLGCIERPPVLKRNAQIAVRLDISRVDRQRSKNFFPLVT